MQLLDVNSTQLNVQTRSVALTHASIHVRVDCTVQRDTTYSSLRTDKLHAYGHTHTHTHTRTQRERERERQRYVREQYDDEDDDDGD